MAGKVRSLTVSEGEPTTAPSGQEIGPTAVITEGDTTNATSVTIANNQRRLQSNFTILNTHSWTVESGGVLDVVTKLTIDAGGSLTIDPGGACRIF